VSNYLDYNLLYNFRLLVSDFFLLRFKLNSGVLNGPDIRKLMRNTEFQQTLMAVELNAWNAVKTVITNVLGADRDLNWRPIVDNMLHYFEILNVNMSLKIHFLHCHKDVLHRQLPSESDEHGERFHQVSAQLEHWYSGKRLDSMLADLCWNLQMELFDDEKDE
jgi:hypothetical protein